MKCCIETVCLQILCVINYKESNLEAIFGNFNILEVAASGDYAMDSYSIKPVSKICGYYCGTHVYWITWRKVGLVVSSQNY